MRPLETRQQANAAIRDLDQQMSDLTQQMHKVFAPQQRWIDYQLKLAKGSLLANHASGAAEHALEQIGKIARKPNRLLQHLNDKRVVSHEADSTQITTMRAHRNGLRVNITLVDPSAQRQQARRSIVSSRPSHEQYFNQTDQLDMYPHARIRFDASGIGTLVDTVALTPRRQLRGAVAQACEIARKRLTPDVQRFVMPSNALPVGLAASILGCTDAQINALVERGVLMLDDGKITRASLESKLRNNAGVAQARLAQLGGIEHQAAHLAGIDGKTLHRLGGL